MLFNFILNFLKLKYKTVKFMFYKKIIMILINILLTAFEIVRIKFDESMSNWHNQITILNFRMLKTVLIDIS